MSEYWVSQAKKFCEFCKCWIADNKPSRDFHEKGKRHQDNVKKKIEEVRKVSVRKAQKEEEMNDSLREMNENALKALKKDLMTNPSLASQYGIKLKPKEPEKLPQYGPEPKPPSADVEEEDSDRAAEAETQEKPAAVKSTVGTWHMAASEEGYPYYWNDMTSEVSWVPPPAYLAQQAGEGISTATKTEDEQGEDSMSSFVPPSAEEQTENTEDDEDDEEPKLKRPKLEETVALADIPLPCDIPLPPPKGEEKVEKEEELESDEPEDEKKGQKEEESTAIEEEASFIERRPPKSNAAYGTWEQIEEQPRMEDIDLGLPQVREKEEPVVTIPVAEPKFKIREKTVSSLGSGPVFFKKPKKKMTAAQFLKKREES